MAAPRKESATPEAQATHAAATQHDSRKDQATGGAASSRPDPNACGEGDKAPGAADDSAAADGSVAGDSADANSAGDAFEADLDAVLDEVMEEASAEASEEASEGALKEAAEWKDKYVRLHAEWDTYRRRQKEQAKVQQALAAEKLVSSLIPVIDDLERSIDYAKKNGETGLLGGVEAVLAKFVDTLEKDGVVVIDPAGEPFEALEAQAVGTVEDASQPEETVADVYQRGYKLGNKVLRPAMVTITTGGPHREKKSEEE